MTVRGLTYSGRSCELFLFLFLFLFLLLLLLPLSIRDDEKGNLNSLFAVTQNPDVISLFHLSSFFASLHHSAHT